MVVERLFTHTCRYELNDKQIMNIVNHSRLNLLDIASLKTLSIEDREFNLVPLQASHMQNRYSQLTAI